MNHPLDFLRTSEVGTLLLVFAAAAYTWSRLFPRLATDEARQGVISLQLAFTANRAESIIGSWRLKHLDGAAKRSQYIDFGYIALYTAALGLLSVVAGRAADASGLMSADHAGTIAAWSAIAGLVAGFCDCLEDVGLLFELSAAAAKRRISGGLVAAATSVAAVKWLLALAVVVASLGILAVSALAAL